MNDFIAKPIEEEAVTQVFDPEQLMALCKDNESARPVLLGMVRRVTNGCHATFQAAYVAWQADQSEEACRILHTMRGSIGSIGALVFADAALKLEYAINTAESSDRAAIEILFGAARQALEDLVQQATQWLSEQDN